MAAADQQVADQHRFIGFVIDHKDFGLHDMTRGASYEQGAHQVSAR